MNKKNNFPLVSIITIVLNRENSILDTLKSIHAQTYQNIEHIIIDGASTDNTLKIIKSFTKSNTKILSEPDKGIYDAINKGLNLATGDIVGFLHSDDIFYDHNTIQYISNKFILMPGADGFYGNVKFFKDNKKSNIVRYVSSYELNSFNLKFGLIPAHTSIFLNLKRVKHILYNPKFLIAGDFDYLLRLYFKERVRLQSLNITTTLMKQGGISTSGFKQYFRISSEIRQSLKINKINSHRWLVFFRMFFKIKEFIKK